MFRVLNNLPRTSSGVQPVPQKDYLIREVQRNLQTIQNHYQGFTFAVQSDHILALLLAQLPMRYDISVQTYYDMILDLTPELGNRVKLTTSRYAGKLFDGAFYQDCTKLLSQPVKVVLFHVTFLTTGVIGHQLES